MSYPSNEIKAFDASALGEPVLVASTGPSGTAGTLIGTVPAGKTQRVELWAWNNSAAVVRLTLQLGTSLASKELSVDIPPKGSDPKPLVFFWPFKAGAEIRAFASVANMVCVIGPINERTPAA